eukprot:6149459-Alexandrium_andersonii.AAC.1
MPRRRPLLQATTLGAASRRARRAKGRATIPRESVALLLLSFLHLRPAALRARGRARRGTASSGAGTDN